MRGAIITFIKGNKQHYTSAIEALNDLKNYLDAVTDEDITLELKYYFPEREKIIFDIKAYKGDWCYGKVGTLEILE